MSRATSRWARWQALSPLQRRTLVLAWWLLPLVWLALWSMGLPRLQAWLMGGATRAKDTHLSMAKALGESVNVAARYTPFPATCLTRSLLLGWLLERRGLASELRIGVQLGAEGFKAHAWIECDGVPVNDRPDVAADFAVFDDLGPVMASFDR